MSILFLLLGLLFALCAAVVLLSGFFLWYETANRQPKLLAERLTAERLRFAGRFLAAETFCLFVTLLLRPLGWFEERQTPPLPSPVPPVLLLNGLFHNRACWAWMARQLRRRGLQVYTLTLPLWHTPDRAVARLAAKIEALAAAGVPAVDLVGHSMGALVIRQYLRERGAERVGRCVLLAAPNHGSRLAALALSPVGRTLLPGSAYLQALNATGLPPAVRCTAIYSRHDNIVLPAESARLDGVRNIELSGIGHTTLLYHPAVADLLFQALTEEKDEND